MSRLQLGLLCGIAASVALLLFLPRSREPRVAGKPLTTWLETLAKNQYEFQLREFPPEVTDAENAVRQLGTNALPFLIELLNKKDTRAIHSLNELIDSINERANLNLDRLPELANLELAVAGFHALGREALPAVPALTNLLHRWQSAVPATCALAAIGGEAVLPVLRALTNQNISPVPMRWPYAFGLLYARNDDAAAIIPALMTAMRDEEVEVRIYATQSIRHFRYDTEKFLPAMLNNLNAPNSRVRQMAAENLGYLGAREAIPALKQAMNDADPLVSVYAKNALERIDPTALSVTNSQ